MLQSTTFYISVVPPRSTRYPAWVSRCYADG